MWVSPEWQLNWNEEMYNMGNKLIKYKWFWVIISDWSKYFPGKYVNTLLQQYLNFKLFFLGYHWLLLATIQLVGDTKEI